jgi:hypothetical protein
MMTDHEILEQNMNNAEKLDIYDKSYINIMSEIYGLQDEIDNLKQKLIFLIIFVFVTFIFMILTYNKIRKIYKKIISKEYKTV